MARLNDRNSVRDFITFRPIGKQTGKRFYLLLPVCFIFDLIVGDLDARRARFGFARKILFEPWNKNEPVIYMTDFQTQHFSTLVCCHKMR